MEELILIASDHRGFTLKEKLKLILEKLHYRYEDLGVDSEDKIVDYPDIARDLCKEIKNNVNKKQGILICKTGIGMVISANKIRGIRAALCLNEEMAKFARLHNDANVLVLSGDFTPQEQLEGIVKNFFQIKEPDRARRHEIRREKVKMLEELEYEEEKK